MIRLCLLLISLFSASSQSQQITNEQLTVGNKITIQSEVLKEQRELLVYLPKNYDATNRYPVIYVLDGEFYFIPTIGVVSSLSATKAIPESIVVAIPTSIRVRDYLPPIKGEAQSNQQQFIKQKFPRFGGQKNFKPS
ncbi:alpha/beta hydrolase-fold protein [Pseudoalteromonas sp. T1lg24]|uniref:alpha/beta hydrolase-fold protein n=1 Tax=Pseudoalteromonas sp. T1lg24 TaxID=2077099 RepID=UPI000CF6D5FE|nr:alpha/beta hydrolase-fold protein [Pseudoalteromonas sp. T1lg24]